MPKTRRKTGGRKAGTPNRSTAAAQRFVDRVERRLAGDPTTAFRGLSDVAVGILKSGIAPAQARMVELLLAYKYGKPTQPVEATGKDGGPIQVVFSY
jgi:hypothetical protein